MANRDEDATFGAVKVIHSDHCAPSTPAMHRYLYCAEGVKAGNLTKENVCTRELF